MLMRNGKIIAHTKRKQNLFTFDLTQLGKVMAMTGRGRPTHFVSKNKYIRLWHRRLAHINNACVVRAFRLVNSIALIFQDTEYDPADILIDSDNSNRSDLSDSDDLTLQQIQPYETETTDATATVNQTKATDDSNILDKLCTPYVGSKST